MAKQTNNSVLPSTLGKTTANHLRHLLQQSNTSTTQIAKKGWRLVAWPWRQWQSFTRWLRAKPLEIQIEEALNTILHKPLPSEHTLGKEEQTIEKLIPLSKKLEKSWRKTYPKIQQWAIQFLKTLPADREGRKKLKQEVKTFKDINRAWNHRSQNLETLKSKLEKSSGNATLRRIKVYLGQLLLNKPSLTERAAKKEALIEKIERANQAIEKIQGYYQKHIDCITKDATPAQLFDFDPRNQNDKDVIEELKKDLPATLEKKMEQITNLVNNNKEQIKLAENPNQVKVHALPLALIQNNKSHLTSEYHTEWKRRYNENQTIKTLEKQISVADMLKEALQAYATWAIITGKEAPEFQRTTASTISQLEKNVQKIQTLIAFKKHCLEGVAETPQGSEQQKAPKKKWKLPFKKTKKGEKQAKTSPGSQN